MKKLLFGVALLAGTLAFAGVDNVVVTFATQGPDKYADDTVVLDGEYYALVWAQKGFAFAGVTAEGLPVDSEHNKILLKAPVAKGGKCPSIMFEIDENDYVRQGLKNGTLSVIMLDTRTFKVGADDVIVKDAEGKPVVDTWGQKSAKVNGYGDTGAVINDTKASADVAGAVATGAKAAVPEAGKGLKIRDIKPIGENVYIYVQGSHPSVRYGLKCGDEPGALADDQQEKYGKGDETDLILVKPMKSGAQFFSVETK